MAYLYGIVKYITSKMRKNYITIVLLNVFGLAISQELQTLNAPTHLDARVNSNQFSDQVAAYEAYWEGKDSNKRGSGFKQMQRWKELWKYEVKEDGTIPSAQELAASWNELLAIQQQNKFINDNDSNWTPLGPFTHSNQGSWSSGQGRVNVTHIDPNDPNKIYVGAPDGGLWVSPDHGDSWDALTEYLPSLGVSGIAVDHANSSIIYIATGDEDASDSYGIGVYKSTDAGATWNPTGTTIVGTNSVMGEIYMHPTNSNILWVVSSEGLFKTTDAGASWTQTQTGRVKEIRLKPNNPDILYIVQQSGATNNILKSTDGGNTFSNIQILASSGRTVIDVTPANPEYLYVLVSNSNDTFRSVMRSTDSGATFTVRNSTTDIYDGGQQAWYDLALTASDTDPELIFTGMLNVWKSTNGGTTFTRGAEWSDPTAANYTHADIHDLKFFNGKLYAGTDGGIYVSDNNGATFSDKTKNGLNIGQFYRIDVAPETSSKIVGGLQDNGGYAFVDNNWINFYGADGMDAAINPTNSNLYYGFIQFGGSMYRFNAGAPGGNGQFFANGPEAGNWITPLEYGTTNILYAGYSKLYRTSGGGFISSSNTTFSPRLDHIRVDPTNDKRILVANSNSVRIAEGQDAYPLDFTTFTAPAGGWGGLITSIEFNQNNPTILYVTSANRVWKSPDGGVTWQNITMNLPGNQTKFVIAHQKNSSNNTLYIATRNAVWYTNDDLTEWILFNTNLPHSKITDLEINTVEGHVVISTYGRGVWRSPVTESSLSVEEVSGDDNSALIYPNPVFEGKAKLSMLIDEPAEVTVYSIDGKLVKKQSLDRIDNQTNLDFSGLSKGIYVINIKSEKHLIRKKVMVK